MYKMQPGSWGKKKWEFLFQNQSRKKKCISANRCRSIRIFNTFIIATELWLLMAERSKQNFLTGRKQQLLCVLFQRHCDMWQ